MRPLSAIRSALVLLTLLSATTVFADRYEDQVRTNLQTRYDYWHNRDDGWNQLPDLRDITLIGEGQSVSIPYTLIKGERYKMVGVCDNDCSDIDFELRDENGNLIDEDTAKDDIPIVEVTPIRTGKFTLRVSMQSCSNSAGCDYGVDVYRSR
jgi:hypothetical protein